jgi:hypothetical protein
MHFFIGDTFAKFGDACLLCWGFIGSVGDAQNFNQLVGKFATG